MMVKCTKEEAGQISDIEFRLVPLSNCDKMAMVDTDDYDYLSQFTWFADPKGYAIRCLPRNGGPTRHMRMHREILNAKPEEQVDHRNRNKLDNRRQNLRIATSSGNAANQGLRKDNQYGYKGISYRKESGRWRALINVAGKRINLGTFDTAEEAALAYNKAALKYHQEYAYLNTIDK